MPCEPNITESGNLVISGGFTPSQIRTAYGVNSISLGSVVGTGQGQTIAIVCVFDNPKLVSSSNSAFQNSDLHKFDVAFGLPDPPSFRKLDQNGGANYPAPDTIVPGKTNWATEAALDVEWAHAIAPMANIVLVEANSTQMQDISIAIDTARYLPGVSVISLSLGWSEDQLVGTDEHYLDSYLTTPAGHAEKITFVGASGDTGSPGTYPAFSSNVLAVGGTNLTTIDATHFNESAWSGSGGGQSLHQGEPSYQLAVQNSGMRQSPDVSIVGNPDTGVAVYDSYNLSDATPWGLTAGTSLGAPLWSGLIAIANQLRASQGLPTLDGRTQTLPGLYALPQSDFNDIVDGSSNRYSATVGYDMVTGLGTPKANLLVPDLAMLKKAAPPVIRETAPSVTEDLFVAGCSQISVQFNESVLGGDNENNFELRRSGVDGIFNTIDDQTVAISANYEDADTVTLQFDGLLADTYRLTVRETITDLRGNKLDGNNDDAAGGNWIRNFTVLSEPPLTVIDVSPSLDGEVLPLDVTEITIQFSDPILGGDTAENFEIRRVGSDGLLGTADDTSVPLTAEYSDNVTTLHFPALSENVYRLIIHDAIIRAGYDKLDGDADGVSGGDWTADFVVTESATLATFESPQSMNFGVVTSTTGSGELVLGNNGGKNAFNGYGRLFVGGVSFQPATSEIFMLDDNQTVETDETGFSGLFAIRKISVPNTGNEDFARTTDMFFNDSPAPITTTVTIVGNLGSDADTTVFATSDGDTLIEPTDEWFGTDGRGTPALIHYIHSQAGLKPTSIERIGDNIQWTYTITVNPQQVVELAYFTILGETRTAAIDAAHALISNKGFGGEAAAFLTDEEQQILLNFDFPSTIATVALDTQSPHTNDHLTATATKWSANNDPVTLTFVWSVNGVTKRTFSSNTALTDTFDLSLLGNGDRGDTIMVSVTPSNGDPVFASAMVTDSAPSVTIVTPSSPQTGNVSIEYQLVDAESDPCSIVVRYSVDSGASWHTATKASGGNALDHLTSSSTGISHTFMWDSDVDIVNAAKPNVLIRITPANTATGQPTDTDGFTVDNYINKKPTQLSLSDLSVAEHQPSGTTVGALSTADPNAGDTFTYTLVDGSGSDDNATFTVDGNTLKTTAVFDYDAQNRYHIRVRSTDYEGLWIEKTFTISVVNVNERPSVYLAPISGPQSRDVSIHYVLTDAESDRGQILVQFSVDEGHTWSVASSSDGSSVTNLTANSQGVEHSFVWDSVIDIGYVDVASVRIRLVPSDNEGPGEASHAISFAVNNFQPLDTIGLFAPDSSKFYLRNVNSAGTANTSFNYGPSNTGWLPIVGDWDRDASHRATVGLYNPTNSVFYLHNANEPGSADMKFQYGPGNSDWIPIAGDWDGNSIDSIGLYNPTTGKFYLRNSNDAGVADLKFQYGSPNAGWIPIVGDWDGNGTDTIGLYNPTNATFYLRNSNTAGSANLRFQYGPSNTSWIPVAGDWDANGTDTVGLYNPATAKFYLHDSNAVGAAEHTFQYGSPNAGWTPLIGHWNDASMSANTAFSSFQSPGLQPLAAAATTSSILVNRFNNAMVPSAKSTDALPTTIGDTTDDSASSLDTASSPSTVDPQQALDRGDLLVALSDDLDAVADDWINDVLSEEVQPDVSHIDAVLSSLGV
jgi:hypothetical protein